MPTVRTSDGSQRGQFGSRFSLIILNSWGRTVGAVALSAALTCAGCGRPSPQTRKEEPKPLTEAQASASAKKEDHQKKTYNREGFAVWYPVPIGSLAKRRAGKDELTAAHDHLRLGTRIRVTHLANGRSVIVRITDRGISKKGASIDVCKEAAEKLGMISEGMARVRMEELPEDGGADAAPDSKTTAAQP